MNNTAQRLDEYRICQKRGHQPDSIILTSNPPKNVCKWCGTHYTTKKEVIETNFPVET